MDPAIILALVLIEVHTLDGRTVWLNEEQILSLSAPSGKTVTDKAECVITLTDRKFSAVKETCDQVRALLRNAGSTSSGK
jgi:uncharacterized protein YlzI (FlbEa/FlbD family)